MMASRRRAVAFAIAGGLLLVALLASFELFVSSIVYYNADFAGGENEKKNAVYRSTEKTKDVHITEIPKSATSLRAANDKSTWSPKAAESDDSSTSAKVEVVGSTLSPTLVKADSTQRPSSVEFNSTPTPTVAVVTSTRTPKSETETTKGMSTPSETVVKVLQSTLPLQVAKEVLWVLVVHFTGKPDRYKAVTSTWFKRTHPRMAIVAFTNERNKELVKDSGIPTVFYSSTESMTEHTLHAIRTALSMFPSAVYVTKADDDGYVYTQRLANTLFSNIPYNYQGQQCPPDDWRLHLGQDFIFACGGSGYTLTRYAAEKLINLPPPQVSHLDSEDVGVGVRLKYALGSELGFHSIDMFWKTILDLKQPYNGPRLSYHYVVPSVINAMHEETYNWRPNFPRSSVPRIFHHLESEPIHPSCKELNPKWSIMTWSPQRILGLSPSSVQNSAFVQYDVLFHHGGIFLKPGDKCTQPLDARLDQFATDFDHDGYYLAFNFHEYGYRSGLFVMRPLSDASIMLYHVAERNISNHPLETLNSVRINVAILPAAGLFERV